MVSTEVLCVLTGFPPWDYLVRERARLFDRYSKEIIGPEEQNRKEIIKNIKTEEHERTMREWQEEWEVCTKGRWVYDIIPNVREWKAGDTPPLDFHTTQALTGHGCFSTFLKKIGKEEDAKCWFCDEENDDTAHTLFDCTK
uniref:uncharacterized protein LOC117611140 n=1 Tax=Osmia lignaria TaxID=473952 RepID=UPI00147838F2|nr:uncharacterized protein LOC117611140 [Osmia lignaria]